MKSGKYSYEQFYYSIEIIFVFPQNFQITIAKEKCLYHHDNKEKYKESFIRNQVLLR
jgi:hypothetical protein